MWPRWITFTVYCIHQCSTVAHSLQLSRRTWFGIGPSIVISIAPLALAEDVDVLKANLISEAESLVKFGLAEESKGHIITSTLIT